jgi:proteasome lid subunit RPN8/RPN11
MPGYHKFSNGGYDAFVAFRALEAIADRAREAAPNEMIGYLVGRPFRDAKGPYAVVTDAIFAESARCGPVTVETTFDDEQRLLTTLLAHYPLAERLGWFHSHPFFLPTYSQTDLENQRFWSEPFQLGLLACLDQAKSVSIFAFKGPEAEAIFPPFTAGGSSRACGPKFRPMRAMEHSLATSRTEPPAEQKRRRWPSLVLLTLAVGIVWPIVYLISMWMMIQTIREDCDNTLRTTGVDPDEVVSPVAPKAAIPAKSDGKPAQVR